MSGRAYDQQRYTQRSEGRMRKATSRMALKATRDQLVPAMIGC